MLYSSPLVALPFQKGETIQYKVKWNGISIGRMSMTFEGLVDYQGRQVYQITSLSDTIQYEGTEVIYADPETWLPIYVLRDLKYLGKKEHIQEIYDQIHQKLQIIKTIGTQTTEKWITKPGPIQNGLLFYYWIRMQALKVGEQFQVMLPTKDYVFSIKKHVPLKVIGKIKKTFLFESYPKGLKIWLQSDLDLIPLKMVFTKLFSVVTMEYISHS